MIEDPRESYYEHHRGRDPNGELVEPLPPGGFHPGDELGFVGIWLAAALYGLILGLLMAAVTLAFYPWQQGVGNLTSILAVGITSFLIGFCFLLILLVPLVVLLSLGVAYAFSYSMGLLAYRQATAAFAGGLAGFLGTVVAFTASIQSHWFAAICVGLLGPGLATLLGQIGGWWGTSDPARFKRRRELGHSPVPGNLPSTNSQPLRFGIRQLLVVTTWLAVIFTLLKLAGWLNAIVLTVLLGWLVFQACTLRLVAWLGNRRLEPAEPPAAV